MKFQRLSRRHFLQGAGVTLALPLLPSLMSRAEAQTVTAPRFFAATWLPHGGISVENAYPLDATSTLTDTTLYPAIGTDGAHIAKSGRLVDLKRTHAATAASRTQAITDFDNGAARVSPLIGSFVSDALLAKMNVLRGIDFLSFGGHTRGFLGNFINRDGGADNGQPDVPVPTLDAVIAASNKFYSTAERALVKAPSVALTWTHLSSTRSGGVVGRNSYNADSGAALFTMLFGGVQSMPGTVDPRASLVDRVYADYSRVARGAFGPGRRVSREDKLRLEEYMSSLQTISDRMRAQSTAACSVPTLTQAQRDQRLYDGEWGSIPGATTAAREAQHAAALETMNMILVAAFSCGTTRAAVRQFSPLADVWDPAIFNTPSVNETQRTDPHGMCFHNHNLADRQQVMLRSQRFAFEHGYVDLMRRMQATQVLPGVSMLDQAVLYWSSECGPSTHDAKSVPAILAGGGGGYFKTGNYVDYTNRPRTIVGRYGNQWKAGLPQNRLLANIAQAMGLAPADYELSDAAYATKFPSRGGLVPGYGDAWMEPGDMKVPYVPALINDMSTKLPLITN